MKYLLLIYLNEQTPLSEAERQDCYADPRSSRKSCN